MGRTAVVLALVLALVVAGCGGDGPATEGGTPSLDPTSPVEAPPSADRTSVGPNASGDGEPSPTATDAPTVRESGVQVYGGNLSVDPTTIFERVERLLDVDARPPAVVVRHPSELSSTLTLEDPFGRALGVRGSLNESPSTNTAAGTATRYQVRLFVTDDSTTADVERTLAHEFTHAILLQTATAEDTGWENYTLTPDHGAATRSIAEGVATYTADSYVERYHPDRQTESEAKRAAYEAADPAVRLFMSHYLAGARYFEQRAGSPANVTRIYERQPWTTEQVLHGHPPDAEPPVPLSPTVDAPAGWEQDGRTTRGELFVRVVLETELDRATAAGAAAGWGADAVTTYRDGNRTGYGWVLRWDTAADATEFREAFRTYLDRRTAERDDELAFRHERIDDRTIAVYVGPRGFVGNVTASVG